MFITAVQTIVATIPAVIIIVQKYWFAIRFHQTTVYQTFPVVVVVVAMP